MKPICSIVENPAQEFVAREARRLHQLAGQTKRPIAAAAIAGNRYPLRARACVIGAGSGLTSFGDHGFAPRAWRIIKKIL